MADDLEEAKLLPLARALVNAAQSLKSEYSNQAAAFNSIMADLDAALTAQNLPLVRAHLKSIRSNLDIKGNLFLQANQRIIVTFEILAKGISLR